MYRVKEEYIDNWYGAQTLEEIEESQRSGFDMEEIERLAREWDVSLEVLMEQVEEI